MNNQAYINDSVSFETVTFPGENNTDQLNQFLEEWDRSYKAQAHKIDLFDKSKVSQRDKHQRQHFVKIFYHSRGDFHDFLWHLGNFAPNKAFKDIILENIAEEFNGPALSHEQFYLDFATKEGLDLSNEYVEQKYYQENIKNFNNLHIKWLLSHKDWNSKLAAFSAYERLDSTDYEFLSNILFEEPKREHIFFKIHRKAKHFDKTYKALLKSWQENSFLVKEAFRFISKAQLDMWKILSNEIFN